MLLPLLIETTLMSKYGVMEDVLIKGRARAARRYQSDVVEWDSVIHPGYLN